MNGKSSAETILHFELYPPLCTCNVDIYVLQSVRVYRLDGL